MRLQTLGLTQRLMRLSQQDYLSAAGKVRVRDINCKERTVFVLTLRYGLRMNLNNLTIASLVTHENLSIFLLHGTDSFYRSRSMPLTDALEQKSVILHETAIGGSLR